ncbi:MAG: hypothetical protein NVSMB24_25310 [Mucilaginibacter sp.]
MVKKLYFLLFCVALFKNAISSDIKTDSVLKIIRVSDQYVREKAMVSYVTEYFLNVSIDSLPVAANGFNGLLSKYKVENREGFDYLIQSIQQGRLLHLREQENLLIKAIESVGKNSDHYLLFTFFNYLAYTQTLDGNVIGSVSSYRMAKKEADILKDPRMQLLIDINISDVYHKYDFYIQSLYYLSRAQAIKAVDQPGNERIKDILYYNKSENFFRMNRVDSLLKYHALLKRSKVKTDNLYTYINRTGYYILLLKHDYNHAIALINKLKTDSLYKFRSLDRRNLAVAYFNGSKPDSAKYLINQLLAEPDQLNHPEIKYQFYQILGKIAEQKDDRQSAVINYKAALQQVEENLNRLTHVGDISSQIKMDEVEAAYIQKSEIYKRQQLWLIFTVVVSFLIILVIAMFYRNIMQKRHYEKILYATKKSELAFINSHEVRKHLSNILGIIGLIKNSNNKEKEYLQAQDHLYKSAESLDDAIKNISEKLND